MEKDVLLPELAPIDAKSENCEVRKMKDLPLGVNDYKDLIKGNFIYVDKTKYLYELTKREKGMYFLSRPR